MSQFDFGVIDPNTKNGTQLADDLNRFRDAVNSLHRGAARPVYVRSGMMWVKEVSAERWDINLYDGANDIIVMSIDPVAHTPISAMASSTEPGVMYAHMWWMDTINNILKQRNGDNTGWMPLAAIVDGQFVPYSAGESAETRFVRTGSDLVWRSKAIGEKFPLDDHMPGVNPPPTDNPNFRFIKLSAGESGVGGYNEGVLINETSIGAAPHITATAEINMPESPAHGYVINLINTEGRYVKPGTASGTLADDQMQRITGRLGGSASSQSEPGTSFRDGTTISEGAFTDVTLSVGQSGGNDEAYRTVRFDFDSATSPGARVGDYTDVKHQQATYYMCIWRAS